MNYIELAQLHVSELYPAIVYAKPQLSDLPPGAIIGTWQYSVPGTARFILNREVELATGVLPADVARAWVKDQYKLPLRRRASQMVRGYPVPLHAIRGLHGDCSYIDIKGAYLRILSMGYDVEYRPGKYIGADPRQVPAEIAAHKFCYSIAVAMSGSALSNITVMGHNGTFAHKPFNTFSNPSLFNLAQETLNGIGAEVLNTLGEHCVYMNTDGYIIKSGHETKAIEIVNSWGFEARVKHCGETEVRGVASWKVGDEQTKRFDSRATDFTGKLMTIDEWSWLRKRWQHWTTRFTGFYNSEQNHNKVQDGSLTLL